MAEKKVRRDPNILRISESEKVAANARLEELCVKYGFRPWDIDASRGYWRELVCAMCGVNVPVRAIGRPAKYSDSEALHIAEQVELERDFGHIKEFSSFSSKKITRKQAFENVAKAINLEKSVQTTKPGSVRKIYNRFEGSFRKKNQENW